MKSFSQVRNSTRPESLVTVARTVQVRWSVTALFSSLFLIFSTSSSVVSHFQNTLASTNVQQSGISILELEKTIEAQISDRQVHTYSVEAQAGQYIHIRIEQREIDLVVGWFGPDGKQIGEVDYTGVYEPEAIIGIVNTSGVYRVTVGAVDENSGSGTYRIVLSDLRAAREQDRSSLAAMETALNASAEGDRLREKKDLDSLKSALENYTEALRAWRAIGDKHWEASALRDVGSVLQQLGQKEKALESFGQAVALFKSLNNPLSQALTLVLMAGTLDVLDASTTDRRRALEYHIQAIPLLRQIGDRAREVDVLNYVGLIYSNLGEHATGLKHFNDALVLARTLTDRDFEAKTLYNTGRAFHDLGERQNALDRYNEALLIFRTLKDQKGEARTLHNIGSTYHALGQMQKALEFYQQGLNINRAKGDHLDEGASLNDIGGVYSDIGEKEKAVEYYKLALAVRRQSGYRSGEAETLSNLGAAYDSLGFRQTALDFYNQAIGICREIDDKDGAATTLNNIGYLYGGLGEGERSLEFYREALDLFRAVNDLSGQATTLNNLGRAHDELGERRKAVDLFSEALALHRQIGERGGEAITLNNLAGVLYDLGNKQEALTYLNLAVSLLETVGDLGAQANSYNSIGIIYSEMGQNEKARIAYQTALVSQRMVGDRSGEANTLSSLAAEWKDSGNPLLGIFYGKQAINMYQLLRTNIQTLNKEQQKTYLSRVEPVYRYVADLLLSQSRLAEAHQTLNLFKDQQFFDFNRTAESRASQLTATPREASFDRVYNQKTSVLSEIMRQRRDLRLKFGDAKANELAQMRELDSQLKTASRDLTVFLKGLQSEFSKADPEKDSPGQISDTSELQTALRDLKTETRQTAVAIYTLNGEDNFRALIVTADKVFTVTAAITSETLNDKALRLWALLQSDEYNPKQLSQQLYTAVFKPLESQLPKDTSTILWMLDGNLRYVPMGALHDGKQYLVERYNHVVFTRADRERLLRSVSAKWTGTAFGSSKAHTVELLGDKISFDALPGVTEELHALFRQPGSTGGLLDGHVLPDAKFTKATMLEALKQRRPLVHISSHFNFRPGDEARSFLLLGDGTALTLSEMKQHADLFTGVELLTLSACNTAAQQAGANGREIDGFAELAQRLGASSVMATLWPVADNSTPWLMREFYRMRQNGLTKAEASRKAQLALLNGTAEVKPLPAGQKSSRSPVQIVIGDRRSREGSSTRAGVVYVSENEAPPFVRDPQKPFAHPYYWAPFILIGNWK